MIRLIVSDIDGTILQKGSRTVPPMVLRYIKELRQKGILFCAASGREYTNLYRLFQSVQDDIMYICVNGAIIMENQRVLCKTELEEATACAILKDIASRDGCEALVSGANRCFIRPGNMAYLDHMLRYVGNDVTLTPNLDKIGEPYLKISAYNPEGIAEDAAYFSKRWARQLPAVVSGACWFDFTAPYVNKGNALAVLQKLYHIDPEDTLVLGDSYNDLEMFEHAYFSYAMEHADEEIKARARFITEDVESVLFDILHMR